MANDTQSNTTTTKCLNCGTEFQGNFCPECGQAAETGRFTMKFIYENLLAAFISKDGGIWFTLKNLFIRPGEMIVEILKGKRRSYFSPFPMLFFTLTVLILLFSITGSREDIKSIEQEIIKAEKDGKTELVVNGSSTEKGRSEFFKLIGHTITFYNNHYTAVTMLTIPLFLFVTRAWYGKTNRKRYYRAEYLIAIAYSMVMVVLYRCLISLMYMFSGNASDSMSNFVPLVIVAALTACFRKMLGFSIAKTAWRSILALVLYYIILGIVLLSILILVFLIVYVPIIKQKNGV